MAFLVKRPELDFSDFADYYENRHVPLILGLAPGPVSYKRNFIAQSANGGQRDDVDVITELVFADRAAYQSWVAAMYAPGSGVAEDEEKFLQRALTRSYVVEERVTPTA